MLQAIAPDLWHLPHPFKLSGIDVSSRMTVVRFADGRLWLHSPVPLSDAVRAQLDGLGTVAYIVAPNKVHHLFASACATTYPQAALFGAPGLQAKRPNLRNLRQLNAQVEPEWQHELDQIFVEGFPFANETVWLHKASRTLILTDLCQWWQGELGFGAKAYARLTGTRARLAVPRTIRLMIKDREAFEASARKILAWEFERVVVAHNAIIDAGAHAAVSRAFFPD